MYIFNLKISNFKSFVGENEVCLRPYSAVMFASDKGKTDFCTAIHFLFGRSLRELGMESIDELYHERFSDIGYSDFPALEVSAVCDCRSSSGETLEISRAVQDGSMVYTVNQNEFSSEDYRRLVNGMGCLSPIFFTYADFVQAIWDNEGLETVISAFLKDDFMYRDIQTKQKNLQIADISLKMQKAKHFQMMMKKFSHVDNIVDEYHTNLHRQETFLQNTIENLIVMTSAICDGDSLSASSSSVDVSLPATQENTPDPFILTQMEESLPALLREEDELISKIAYKEMRIAVAEDDVAFIQGKKLEKLDLENRIAKLELDNSEILIELSETSDDISNELAVIEEARVKSPVYVSRLTAYGRLIDWIKPGQFLWILRHVMGDSLLYAHLVDQREDAKNFLGILKDRCVQSRESFLVLSDYPELREMLFEGGENGIVLKTPADVLTLLSKFKKFSLIHNVPLLVFRGELCLAPQGSDCDAIFTSTGEFTAEEGTFGRKNFNSPKNIDVSDVLSSVNQQLEHQDKLFDLLFSQHCKIFKLRLQWDTLNKSETRMARLFPRRTIKPTIPAFATPDIYKEYNRIFADYEKTISREIINFDAFETNQLDVDKIKNEVKILKEELAKIEQAKKEREKELRSVRKCLNRKFFNALQETLIIGNPYVHPQPAKEKSALTLLSRMKEIKKIIDNDDMDQLKGGAQWRSMVLESLRFQLTQIKKEAVQARKDVEKLISARIHDLEPLTTFCNETMAEMLQKILGRNVSCELKAEKDEILKLFVKFENNTWMNIMDCSMFVRCAGLLVLFLHVASIRKGAVLLIDDVSEFLPKTDSDARCVLENPDGSRFDLMARFSEAIKVFLQQNIEENGSSPRNERLMNLDQVLLLTSDDLAVCTDAQVIIVQDILSDSNDVISAMMNI